MKQPRTRIAAIIADRTLKDGNSKRFSTAAAAYLLSERRVYELDSVLRDVQTNWAKAGYVEVITNSAHDLTPAIRAEIIKHAQQLYPAAKKIVVTERRDPEVIGGVRLGFPNQQLDLSLEAKLNKFKQLTNTGKEY